MAPDVYAETLAAAERAAEAATERLNALRAYGRGPVGAPGCCRAWVWRMDPLGAGWAWARVGTCNATSDDSDACDHEHHEHDGTWLRLAR